MDQMESRHRTRTRRSRPSVKKEKSILKRQQVLALYDTCVVNPNALTVAHFLDLYSKVGVPINFMTSRTKLTVGKMESL